MRRFFVPPEECRDDTFDLPEREARHAAQVLRLGSGDKLIVLDGAGSVLRCEVVAASKRSVRVRACERSMRPHLPCAITLIQAMPKGAAFDSIVQKATELGATRIIPLLSERVVTHADAKHHLTKVEKWRQIAIESIKQCGSPWLPAIEAPVRIETLLLQTQADSNSPRLSVVCSLDEKCRTLREAVAEFRASRNQSPSNASLWIGPEGDFTAAEYEGITLSGATPITLGPLTLRADTAATACLAIANHELQQRV